MKLLCLTGIYILCEPHCIRWKNLKMTYLGQNMLFCVPYSITVIVFFI